MPTPMRRRLRHLAISAAVTSTVLCTGAAASAQDDAAGGSEATAARSDARFAVQPSGPDGPGHRDWFTYTLDPGDDFGDTVAISNLSDVPIRFEILASDALGVADAAGFAALRDPSESVGVGAWIELAADEYTVQPGERIDVPFRISVPADAEPGDHAGAILAADADAGAVVADGEGIGLDVRYRLGARVYVRVGGDIAPAVRIDDLRVQRDGDQAVVTWDVHNTGNVRLQPTAEVRVTGWFGRTVASAPAEALPELLPGSNYAGATVLTGMTAFEPLTAHVTITAEELVEPVERSLRFQPHPWSAIVVGAAALLLVAAAYWWRRRRTRGEPGPAPRDEPAEHRVPVPA